MPGTGDIRGPVIAAMRMQDADAFEVSLLSAFEQSREREIADLLVEAVPMPWHHSHEDVVHTLQRLRHAAAVDVLAEAALTKHQYLAYDNSYALARKCTWALADIGTDAAREKLQALSRCADETIAGYAQRRLDRWDLEIGRKGVQADLQEITPSFTLAVPGFAYLGRGPDCSGEGGGWLRSADIMYRCAACGSMMPASQDAYFSCSCGSMHLDVDYGRFGSSHGDQNVLVYRRSRKPWWRIW